MQTKKNSESFVHMNLPGKPRSTVKNYEWQGYISYDATTYPWVTFSYELTGGLPFLLDSSATIPVDVMLRERTLDLWNFVAQQAGPMNQDRIRKVVRIGKLTREISTFMRDEEVDLLVLKQRQRRLFPDFTTLRLLAIAGRLSCPVLLDPPADRDRSEPRNGLLAFDLLAQAKLLSSRQIV